MRWKAHMKKITSRLSVNTRCCNFPPHSSCSDFSPPSPVYCPGRDSSTRRNEAHDILRGESCCQPGPLEPTYCVFAEAAVEQNAALGSISHTSREQDEALLALLALLAQRTGLSLYHIQRERDNEEFMGDDKLKGLSEARERERNKVRRSDLLAWTGWFCSKCTLLVFASLSSWLRPRTADLSSLLRSSL